MPERARKQASFSAFSFGAILAAAAALLWLVSTLACQDGGSERLKAPPPSAKQLAGEWHVTSATSSDTCNLGPNVQPIQGYFSIQVNGTSFTLVQPCSCSITPWGTGTLDGTVVTIHSERTVTSTLPCPAVIDEVDTGILDGNGFSGDASLAASLGGGCGTRCLLCPPCQIHATFTAERCPATGCGTVCPAVICPG